MPDSLQALRDANPRGNADFERIAGATAAAVRERIAGRDVREAASRRRLAAAVGAALLAAAVAAGAVLTVASSGGGPGVEDAAAAFRKATTLTTASAERSGTAVVRITHDGETWAGATITWHGDDLAVTRGLPRRERRPGSGLLVVDGKVYGVEPRLGWVEQGTPENIDPGSGTTPQEYLAAVREDVGGATLRRIAAGMAGPQTSRLPDGSSVYRGTVAAGLIARKTGSKEGQTIHLLPFGFVAHKEAANAAAPLDVAATVGAEGIVRELRVSWGTWTYSVMYRRLGSTPALKAPANATSLREWRAQIRDGTSDGNRP